MLRPSEFLYENLYWKILLLHSSSSRWIWKQANSYHARLATSTSKFPFEHFCAQWVWLLLLQQYVFTICVLLCKICCQKSFLSYYYSAAKAIIIDLRSSSQLQIAYYYYSYQTHTNNLTDMTCFFHILASIPSCFFAVLHSQFSILVQYSSAV